MDFPNMIEGGILHNESLYQELERLRIEKENWRVEKEDLTKRLEEAAARNIYDSLYAYDSDLAFRVLNHQGVRINLETQLQRIKRQGKFSLLAIDIDNFKITNDKLGHAEGDRLLIEFARLVSNHVRNIDLIGRPGGDEFVIGLIDADEDKALEIAERIRKSTPEELGKATQGLIPNQTISIGVAQARENDHLEILRKRADQALYKAKEEKNKIHVFSQELF